MMRSLAPFTSRDFRRLWLGNWLAALSIPPIATALVVEITKLARDAGPSVFRQRGAAVLVTGVFAGAMADRLPRRSVLLGCLTACAILCGALGVSSAVFGGESLVFLIAASVAVAVVSGLFHCARESLAAELVPLESRPAAVAWSVAPAIAVQPLTPFVVALSYGSTALTFLILGTFAILAATVFSRLPMLSAGAQGPWVHEIAAGLRHMTRRRRLRISTGFGIPLWFVACVSFSLILRFAEFEPEFNRHHHPNAFAMQMGGILVSSAMGALGSAWLMTACRPVRLAVASGVTLAVGLVALSRAEQELSSAGAVFVVGLGCAGLTSSILALLVEASEPEYFGRLLSLPVLAYAAVTLLQDPLWELLSSKAVVPALIGLGVLVLVLAAGLGFALQSAGDDVPAPPTARRPDDPYAPVGRHESAD